MRSNFTLNLVPLYLSLALAGLFGSQFSPWVFSQSVEEEKPGVDVAGPIKIAALLWNANTKSAAETLSRSIGTALDRGNLSELRVALAPLQTRVREIAAKGDSADPRFAPSVAAMAVLGDANSAELLSSALEKSSVLSDRELIWKLWCNTESESALVYFRRQLAVGDGVDDNHAWQSAFIREALVAHRESAARITLSVWGELAPSQQLAAIEPLTNSPDLMHLLLDAVAAGTVSKDMLNANQLRKWLNGADSGLEEKIEAIWGQIRMEDSAGRQQLVARMLQRLNSGVEGSASRGEKTFERVCSQCHVLHDKGFEVGPNITNNGRGNLQQLVSNVLDPSLVIGEAYQAKTVLTADGEVVAGLIAAEDDRYLKLKIQGGKVVEFEKEELEQIKSSTQSLMPEGVETQMTEQELFDLFAYLCLAKPIDSDDNELISGTPEGFVQP